MENGNSTTILRFHIYSSAQSTATVSYYTVHIYLCCTCPHVTFSLFVQSNLNTDYLIQSEHYEYSKFIMYIATLIEHQKVQYSKILVHLDSFDLRNFYVFLSILLCALINMMMWKMCFLQLTMATAATPPSRCLST